MSVLKLTKNIKIICELKNQTIIRNRYYSTQIGINLKPTNGADIDNSLIASKRDLEWESALPYEKVPGPTRLEFIRAFLPGGKYHKKSIIKIHEMCRDEYGDILVIPGIFGKRDLIITFSPENFRKIFRTEGIWPVRRGLDSINYYRKVARPELFENAGGLVAEQGEQWQHFRTIVNPVLMQPKTVKLYVPAIDQVVKDFLERIRKIRDPVTLEVPKNFEEVLNNWTLESIGVIALNTRLGLISENIDPKAQKLISTLKDFFQLVYELDIKPSMWKYIRTPKFTKLMKTLDTMTTIISDYIDEAKIRLIQESKDGKTKNEHEQSILEKLLKVDVKVARVMAMDMLMAGVDTTSSAFVGCLFNLAKNPDKQECLRNEIKKILPDKTTSLTSEKMNNMPYLRACIKESLRLMPVVLGNFRTTGQDIVLNGYRIPKGIDITMNSYLLQTDDKNFPNAKKFIPERWLRKPILDKIDNIGNNNNGNNNGGCPSARETDPFIFLPFGFGPRMCIGKRLVELELECALSRIIRNFYIEYNYPDIVFKANVINVPSGDLKFKFIDIDK